MCAHLSVAGCRDIASFSDVAVAGCRELLSVFPGVGGVSIETGHRCTFFRPRCFAHVKSHEKRKFTFTKLCAEIRAMTSSYQANLFVELLRAFDKAMPAGMLRASVELGRTVETPGRFSTRLVTRRLVQHP